MSHQSDRSILAKVDELIQLQRRDEARSMVESYLAEHPDDASGWGYHGLALVDSDPAAALTSAQRAVGLEPERVWLHRVVAIVAHEAGELRLAATAAERAVMLDPHDPQNHRILADQLIRIAGRRDDALRAANEACRLAPDDPRSLVALGNARLGMSDYERAAEHYRAALASDPGNPVALHNLALCHNAMQDHGTALTLLQDLLVASPGNAGARSQLDRALRDLLNEFQWLALFAGLVLAIVAGLLAGQ